MRLSLRRLALSAFLAALPAGAFADNPLEEVGKKVGQGAKAVGDGLGQAKDNAGKALGGLGHAVHQVAEHRLRDVLKAIHAVGAGWRAAHNRVSLLSEKERKKLLGVAKLAKDELKARLRGRRRLARASAPPAIDWRDHDGGNYVTPVKQQGGCGSCWAFSTTGALESYMLRTSGQPGANLDLAEQIVLSCSDAGSCKGGNPLRAADFLTDRGNGEEAAYPYETADGDCKAAADGWEDDSYKIGGWVAVDQDVGALKAAIAEHGPMPVTLDVYSDFFNYKDGVYRKVEGKQEGRHSVLVVGYSDEGGYFIVKNSWGEDWGEDGFFRVAYSEVKAGSRFGQDAIAFVEDRPLALVALLQRLRNLIVRNAGAESVVSAGADGGKVLSYRRGAKAFGRLRVTIDDEEPLEADSLESAAKNLPDGPHRVLAETPDGLKAALRLVVVDGRAEDMAEIDPREFDEPRAPEAEER